MARLQEIEPEAAVIGHQLAIQAERNRKSVALVYGTRRSTYAQLNDRACRLAGALAALGIDRGERVATLLFNCDRLIEALFATIKLGAIFAPINFRLVAREVGQLLDVCKPRVLLAGPEFRGMLATLEGHPSFPQQVIEVDDSLPETGAPNAAEPYETWLSRFPAEEPTAYPPAEDILMLLHSSGTTGLPKGVMFSHGTTLASSLAKIIDFGLGPDDTAVVFGPLFHVGPLMDLTFPLLLRGGRVVIGSSRQFDPQRLLRTIADERGTVVPIYPAMLRRVTAVPDPDGHDLAAWRLAITGGEAVPIPVLQAFHDRFAQVALVNNYGSTEGGPITTWLPAADGRRKMGSVGKPSFSVAVRIADEVGRPLPAGEVGEILVRSPYVCRGYWQRPDLAAESLRDGWWHTGDLARRDDDGYIWIAGRKKDMLKSGTENVYPAEVEQVIAMLDGVIENAVIGVPDAEWGETVAAFVVTAPNARIDADLVIEHCRRHLASYKKPRHVLFVDALPRNTTNKVNKAALRAQFDRRS